MDKRFWKITEHAYNTVPLYMLRKKSFNELKKWEDIPILYKSDILSNAGSFYSGAFFGIGSKEIMKRHTSGTTGKYLELYWNIYDYRKSLIPIWIFRKKYYDIKPSDKMCYFYTTSNIGYKSNIEYEEEECRNVRGFSKNNLNRHRMSEIYREIVKYNPIWLFIQPSMALLLCDAAEESGRGIEALRYVEFTGEMLTKEVRKRVENVFGCKTADHYGCNEVNTIAFECPFGKLHVISKDIYVEAVQMNTCKKYGIEDEGELLITSSVNRVNPFIRYNIGDRGRVFNEVKCKCGCSRPVIELTGGRVHDFVVLKDGTKVNSYIFVHAVEMVNREYESCILQFRVIQNDYDSFQVKLVIDEEVSDIGITEQMIKDKFISNMLHPDIGDIRCDFEFCSKLFLEEGGKWCWFIRNVGIGG